jgi:hypothetical protein
MNLIAESHRRLRACFNASYLHVPDAGNAAKAMRIRLEDSNTFHSIYRPEAIYRAWLNHPMEMSHARTFLAGTSNEPG